MEDKKQVREREIFKEDVFLLFATVHIATAFIPIPKKGQRMFKLPHNCTHLTR